MVIKIFFAVLVLCTLAVVAVIVAVHFRVKRHLQEQTAATQDLGLELGGSNVVSAPATGEVPAEVLGTSAAGSEPANSIRSS